MAAEAPLGKFVNSLIRRAAAGFDHIEDSPLVRGEPGDLAGNFAAEGGALAKFLLGGEREENKHFMSEMIDAKEHGREQPDCPEPKDGDVDYIKSNRLGCQPILLSINRTTSASTRADECASTAARSLHKPSVIALFAITLSSNPVDSFNSLPSIGMAWRHAPSVR